MLRNRGLGKDADLLANDVAGALQSGDMAVIGSTLKSLDDYYYKAPKPQVAAPEKEGQTQEYTSDELAMRIQDTLSLADERVVDLPNSDLSRLSSFVAKGDTKKASEQLGKISTFIDNSLKIQTEEDKKPQVLADGTQIEIGSKSGTRYMGGQPVSKGAINSDVFNSMYQKNAASQQKQFAEAGVPMVSSISLEPSQQYQVAPVEGVVAQPEIYAQAVKEAPTSMQEKQMSLRDAIKMYQSGDQQGALALVNASGGKGLMGMVTLDELPGFLGITDQVEAKQPPTEKPKDKLPSSIEVDGKTYKRPEGFTDDQWNRYLESRKK